MRKILKALWDNYYRIVGAIILVIAYFQPEDNIGLILCVLAVACWILQNTINIKNKLENMETSYLKYEIANANNMLSLTKVLVSQNKKVEEK